MLKTLAIATLNIWGLPGYGTIVPAPLKTERVLAICEQIQASDLSVVLLQEVWDLTDRDLLKQACGFEQSVDLEDRTLELDSGLLILSRLPILERDRLTYPAAGAGSGFGEGLAHKSAIFAKVETNWGSTWIGNTHVMADYGANEDARLHDRIRAEQIGAFVRRGRELAAGGPLILGGDWNLSAWLNGKPDPRFETIRKLLPEAGTQLDSDQCTYCGDNSYHEDDQGHLDYLVSLGGLKVLKAERAFDQSSAFVRGSNLEFNLSDHYGWRTELGVDK